MFEIRKVATTQDVAVVVALAREIWSEHYGSITGLAQVNYMLEKYQSVAAISQQMQGGVEYYLALHDEAPAGYLAVIPDRVASTLMISKIYVKRDLRGQGLGLTLVTLAERLCHERGLVTLWLTVNKHNCNSIAWYEHNGFVNAGALVADIGGGFVMDDFKFIKQIVDSSMII